MNIKPNKIIFSVYDATKHEDDNLMAHGIALHEVSIRGHNVREVLGAYKGIEEKSILVSFDSIAEGSKILELVESLCKLSNQESFLFVHNDNTSELRFLDGDVLDVGVFKTVPEQEAKLQSSYTFDPATNQYWIAR